DQFDALLAAEPHEEAEVEQVAEHLVGEGGVEAHVGAELFAGHLDLAVNADRDAPGEGGRLAEGFLVEEVAPAPDGLSDRQAGDDDVTPLEEGEAAAIAVDEDRDGPADDRALDAEATGPDREDILQGPVVTGVAELGYDEAEAG